MPDGGARHTEAVTPDATAAEREASARTAVTTHKDSCPVRADVQPCQTCTRLTFEWRQAVRELKYAPLNHTPASGQITTEGTAR